MSLSPSDQQTPGSFPPWPLLDFNTPLSSLLSEEEAHLPSSFFMGSKSSSPSPSMNSPQLLSSSASMGASTGKVSKRKSRAVNKPPIRVLSADRATFRDMVQKLTGIPTSPSMQASRLWGGGSSGIFRPMAARPGLQSELLAAAHQSMPTLDTSSAYLARGFSSNNLVYNEVGKGGFDASLMHAGGFDPSRGVMYEEGAGSRGYLDQGGVPMMDMESLRRLQRASELESVLMGSSKLEDLLQSNKMDHWFSPDLLHTPSPQVQIAHSA